MDEMAKAPNIVPKGAIRLSEAFERLYRRLTPEWNDLAERCVRWDEASLNQHEEEVDLGEDPYRVVVVSTNRAENIFRWALRDGELRAYVHNERTGIDLELNRQEWLTFGEQVGINGDYTGPQMPGPDCTLNRMRQPIFLFREELEQWMAQAVGADAPNLPGSRVSPVRGEANKVLATRAFSVEEVMERTGLSKTKLYEEIERRNLRARKCGVRTLILESDLDAFLNGLQEGLI
jgi:excisionase family DNA binding protein